MLQRLFLVLSVALSISQSRQAFGETPATHLLRVLTYNIHHGEGTDGRFDYQRLAQVVTALAPDVVALQEVDRGTKRAAGVDQAAQLAELTGMHYGFGAAMPYAGGEYGEALLSRFPITRLSTHHLPFQVGQEPRAALVAEITLPAPLPKIVLVGTHLCHQSRETRRQQTQQLRHLLPRTTGPPIILAGDMNARPDSMAMRALLEEGWVDAIAPQSRIDYVLIRRSDPWQVKEVTIVPDDVTSDHRPVLVVLQWKPN